LIFLTIYSRNARIARWLPLGMDQVSKPRLVAAEIIENLEATLDQFRRGWWMGWRNNNERS
jgi:hypothetical protein